MSTGLDTSTVTPGRTAPDVSFTTPVIDASTPCADANAGASAAIANTTNNRTTPRIVRPPSLTQQVIVFGSSAMRMTKNCYTKTGFENLENASSAVCNNSSVSSDEVIK